MEEYNGLIQRFLAFQLTAQQEMKQKINETSKMSPYIRAIIQYPEKRVSQRGFYRFVYVPKFGRFQKGKRTAGIWELLWRLIIL